ncbi:hypothetical protein BD408DRAFT_345349 [Parasitella parasitica]|nr:hypothetical protein BD408DRAFT_345349 [Parasitella parasitica]
MMGIMISRLPLYEDQRELGDNNPRYSPDKAQNIIRVLAFALSNVHRESQFFTDILSRKPYQESVQPMGQKAWTSKYVGFVRKVAREGGYDLGESLVVLWAMEAVFFNAWTFAKAVNAELHEKNEKDSKDVHFRTCHELMSNWTMGEFEDFVDDCEALLSHNNMSSDEPPVILLRWCKDRTGIRLKTEYLRAWRAARSEAITNYEHAYAELVAEFLNTDISATSVPVIQDDYDKNPVDTFPVGYLREGCGVVLQIQDALDIRHSAFSLLNSLSNATPVRQTYIERNEGDDVNIPRGMLQWVLTDGSKQIYAMELETIPGLDLKTPFGCKLLIKRCRVRRGMLLLTKENVKVLGGNVVELYGGDMIAELEDRCKRKLGIIEEPITPIPAENNRNRGVPAAPISSANDSRTRVSREDAVQTEQVEGFDDDFGYDHLMLGSIETNMAGSDMMESVDMDSNITPPDMPNGGFFSDDDFMDPPQISPHRTSTTLAKRTKALQPSPAISKRSRVEPESPVAEVPTSATIQTNEQDQDGPTPMETEDDDTEDLSFVDPSVWKSFEMAANNDKIEIDEQRRANCSFDVLKQTLINMREQTKADIPDIFRVKLQCIKIARLLMSKDQLFHLELELGDPVVKYEVNAEHEGTIRAKFDNEVRQHTILIQLVLNLFFFCFNS